MIDQNLAKMVFYFWFKFLWMHAAHLIDQHNKAGEHKSKIAIMIEDAALALFGLGQLMGICGKNPNMINEKMIAELKAICSRHMRGFYKGEQVFSKNLMMYIDLPWWCKQAGISHVSFMLDNSMINYPFGILQLEFNENPFFRINLDIQLNELYIDQDKEIIEHRNRALNLLLGNLDIING